MSDYLGSAGAGELARVLRGLPEDVRRDLRPALRAAGSRVRATAAGNASWSSRIPGALYVTTSGTQGRSAVTIGARASAAPHARPYEGITGARSFRHPVYGRDVWVSQACRPFLAPAVESEQAAVVAELGDVVGRALTRA